MASCSFEKVFPESTCWTETEQIIDILNKMKSFCVPNHMLFPSKGGEDFESASKANEHGCIYIQDNHGAIYIMKPRKLHYEVFSDSNWNYFLLELEDLDPILGADNNRCYESLIENTSPLSSDKIYEPVDDYPEFFPDGHRKVYRYLKGSFLFVMKEGYYNNIGATYDGRHATVSPLEFREYVNGLCTKTEELKRSTNR